MAFGNEFLLGFDLWPIWNAVRCPTLVLRGTKSAVLSAATAKRMRKSGPRAQVVDIEGVGHAPWLMCEEQIRIIRDFLLSPAARVILSFTLSARGQSAKIASRSFHSADHYLHTTDTRLMLAHPGTGQTVVD